MIIELITTWVVLGSGAAVVRAGGLRGWPLLAIGYLTGTALYIAVGLVQLALPVPTTPLVTLPATATVALVWAMVAWRRGVNLRVSPAWSAVVMAATVGWVALWRSANLLTWHVDSLVYLQMGGQLAWGNLEHTLTPNLISARLIGIPLIHAPASLTADYYLRAAVPTLALALGAAVVWFFMRSAGHTLARRDLRLIAGIGVAVLVTSNRVVWHALYINGHLMAGAFILLVAGCSWLLIHGRITPALGLSVQGLAVVALTATRPEGAIMASLALAPLLIHPQVSARVKAAALAWWSSGTVVWFGYAVFAMFRLGYDHEMSMVAMAALGVIGAVAAVVFARGGERLSLAVSRRSVLVAIEAGLWAALAFLASGDLGLLTRSLGATARNQVQAGWGVTMVGIGALVVLAWWWIRAPGLSALRFVTTTFIPLVFILAYLRDAAYRVGPTDSLNRMWVQIIPVAVVFVMAAVAHARQRELAAAQER